MTMREDKWPGTKKATKHTQCIFQHLKSKYIQVFTLFTKIELCKGLLCSLKYKLDLKEHKQFWSLISMLLLDFA